MIDYSVIGAAYKVRMSDAERRKAVDAAVSKASGKAMVSIVVGGKASSKALVMTSAQFESFRKGFSA